MAPAISISTVPPEQACSSLGVSSRSTWPLATALRRQPNNCEGDIPYRRATADTFASGASASSRIRALVSSGQFRRDTAGLLSIRPGTTSSNWKLLSLGIGADIETHTVIKSDVQIIQLKAKRQTGAPWRLHIMEGGSFRISSGSQATSSSAYQRQFERMLTQKSARILSTL